MTLEFRPPFEINPNAPSRNSQALGRLNETFNNIGNQSLQYSQQQKENKIRDAMLQLQQQQGTREQGAYNFEYGDPSSSVAAPSPSGSLQQGTTGPQPNVTMADTGMPGFAAPGAPSPQGPQPGQPWHQPGTDLTSHFNNWKQQGGGAYGHPELSGPAASSSSNPMDRYSQLMQVPGAKRRAEGLAMFKESDTHDLQQSEIEKNRAQAGLYRKGGAGGDKGTWHLNPMSGEMQWYPTSRPTGDNGGPTPSQGSGPTNGALQLPYKDRVKLEMEKPKAQGALQNTLREYDNMINEANAIKNDPSLSTATGMTSFMGSVPGTGAKNVSARLETLKAKTLLNVLGSLKNLSANGSSGFGQLSQSEGDAIRNSVSSFDRHLGTPDFKASIDRFTNEMGQRKKVLQDTFNQTYGGGMSDGNANGTDSKTIGGKTYIKQNGQWFEQ